MSDIFYNNLVSHHQTGAPLPFGEASYWATKFFRQGDHYAFPRDATFKSCMKKGIENHDPLSQIAKKTKKYEYLPEPIESYTDAIYDHGRHEKSSVVKQMIWAGLDMFSKDPVEETCIIAELSGLNYKQVVAVYDILQEPQVVDTIKKPSVLTQIKDSFFALTARGALQEEAKTRLHASAQMLKLIS